EHFRQAIGLEPKEATFHFQLALALSALGQNEEAKQEFEKTAQLDPLHGGAQYQLATYARKAGDQQAFARYMRDYQRIRQLKGPADALALEECKYTKPESVEGETSLQPQVEVVRGSFVKVALAESSGNRFPSLVSAAVLAIEDSGQYQLVGATAEGDLVIFTF